MSLGRLIRSGMLGAPFVLGPAATLRLNKASDFMEGIRKRVLPGPHFYLFNLGIDPAAQGQGLTRRLLTPLLDRADRERMPCYLETLDEKNLGIYRRFGFEVASADDIPGAGIRTWAMVRPPPAP